MLIVRSATEIIDEIRRIKRLDSDVAVGELFGVKQTTVASWRARNSLPFQEIIVFCVQEGISTDKIFLKQGPVRIYELRGGGRHNFTRSYDVDDLFVTRLIITLKDRTVVWLSAESNVDKKRIEDFIYHGAIPTVHELEAIADAFKVSATSLAERSPSPSENWMYEYYRKDDGGFPYAELYKLYLAAAEELIEKMQGLISLSTELIADVIKTACRVHLKETPDSREVNYDLIRFLLTLAR